MAWLFMIILNPFATKLFDQPGEQEPGCARSAVRVYSLLQALASVVLLAMLRHMVWHDQAPGVAEPVMIGNAWQAYGLPVGFGLSIPVFFVTPYGWMIWIVVPLLVHRLYRLRYGKPRHPGVT